MRTATASELADYLVSQMPIYGSISRAEAERLLFRHGYHPTIKQVRQAILVADGSKKIVREHGGTTLRLRKSHR